MDEDTDVILAELNVIGGDMGEKHWNRVTSKFAMVSYPPFDTAMSLQQLNLFSSWNKIKAAKWKNASCFLSGLINQSTRSS